MHNTLDIGAESLKHCRNALLTAEDAGLTGNNSCLAYLISRDESCGYVP